MYYSDDTLQKHLVQVRRIAQSREKNAERRIHKIYNDLVKDLQDFVGEQYAKYADEEDILSIALLQQKGSYARFIEEVEKKINIAVPIAAKEIKETVEKVYTMCYNGILEGVKKSVTNEDLHNNLKEIKGCTPKTAKRAVQNHVNGLTLNKTLERNRKEVIYNINKEITVGLNQGDRYSTVARRLSDKVDMSYGKAIRIVRTETHKVREGGMHDASNNIDEVLRENSQYGLRMVKTWRNMGDSKVRPSESSKGKSKGKGKNKKSGGIIKVLKSKTKKKRKGLFSGGPPNHIIMDKQTVLQNEMFDLGDGVKAIAPGHSGVAGHDCNCRCIIVEHLMTEDEFFKVTSRKFDDNKNLEIKISNNEIQNYKPVEIDKNDISPIDRGSINITARKVKTANNDIYVSDNVKLKPKQLHNIDKNISEALKKLNISENKNLPKIFIINNSEMQTGALASYNPVKNILCLDQNTGISEKLLELQKDCACPKNQLSTFTHEYIHWKDAEEYRSKFGKITNNSDYKNWLNKKCKKKLDMATKKGYNIDEISGYAKDQYSKDNYDEVYTEYRVKNILKG